MLLRIQNYGEPPATIASSRHADLIDGEGWNFRQLTSSRWASSASHLFGRPVTTSETWTWLHSPAFRATPLDVKAEADQHFLSGINQLIGHGWPYSPPQAGTPGWPFYAAAVFTDKNPWWPVMPDLARLPAARELPPAPGRAGGGRRALRADRRRLGQSGRAAL